MIDKSSTTHWIIDFASGIMSCQAKYFHLKRNLSKLEKENAPEDEIKQLKERIARTCLRRRQKMDTLGKYAKDYNYSFRCLLKHSMEEYMFDLETWNSLDDPDFYQYVKASEADFIADLSGLLGIEYTECMECLNDSLRNQEFEK